MRDRPTRWTRLTLANTRQHRSNGRWSDGVPIAPLKIQDAAPSHAGAGGASRRPHRAHLVAVRAPAARQDSVRSGAWRGRSA